MKLSRKNLTRLLPLVFSVMTLFTPSARATPDATVSDFLARPAYYNGTNNALPYRPFVPDGYSLPANAGRQYPIVLFMHGSGERGTDNSTQVTGAGAPVLGLVTGPNRDHDGMGLGRQKRRSCAVHPPTY